MTPPQWQRVKQLFAEALEREVDNRRAFVAEACAGDPELRSRVESLLASDEDAGEFLAEPAIGCCNWDALESGSGDEAAKELIQGALMSAIEELPEQDGAELIGTRLGRYRITGLIGKGGMGSVYRAVREDDFRMVVAIKLLKRGTDTDAALSRFRAERQILAGLQHSNIARLLDGGATEIGLPYLVMEYVDGTPLVEYAARLPIRQRVELFRSVCLAVEYAHQNGLCTGTLSPRTFW